MTKPSHPIEPSTRTEPRSADPSTQSIPSQTALPFESASIPSRQNGWIRGTVYTALFAALFVAFSSISISLGFSPVPITLQTLAVMLAGGLLGPVFGFWSIAIVVLLTATGLPLLHGQGGLAVLYGFTGGFIWMFPFAALFIGWVSDWLFRGSRKLSRSQYVLLGLAIFIFGVLLVYAGGVPWFAHKAGSSIGKALASACYPFLPGDLIKTIVAAALIGTLRPLVPGLRPRASTR
ncbi:biotin transporter BioY [Cohnella lubricantis]|uniref:Biotin transporter BioY n=1 Tax=Cohnella lubricantis TaxID=2163172 RepID=A0A841TAH5_9BACL|nr:biotin transporter BioY [Cohnella lubricantis]MBB6677992.1 biotin transporter BioY [Cohnella lubricantis]MBP2120546.1 biotin transport system substrate-specific component [Cohnella lubricantis]